MKRLLTSLSLFLFIGLFFSQQALGAQGQQTKRISLIYILSTHDDLIGAHSKMDFAAVTSPQTGLSGSMKALYYDRSTRTLTSQEDAITAVGNYNEALTTKLLGDLMIGFLHDHGTPFNMSVFAKPAKIKQISAPSVGKNGQNGQWEITLYAANGYNFSDGSTTYTFNLVVQTSKN